MDSEILTKKYSRLVTYLVNPKTGERSGQQVYYGYTLENLLFFLDRGWYSSDMEVFELDAGNPALAIRTDGVWTVDGETYEPVSWYAKE